MSLPGEFLSEEQFTCSICLEIFTNPVSTPCGHSFCLTCINYYWEGYGKSCFCPLCKENFRKRPELHVNHTLKEITEQFKRMAETTLTPKNTPGDLQANTPPSKPAGKTRPVELPGGLLSEMKSRFQKSGFPETSASEPTTAATLKRRVSTDGTNGMAADGSHCSRHWQSLDLFCKTDQRNICAACAEQEHCGHTVVDAKREMNIKKSQLRIMEVEMQDLIKAREKKMEEIQTSLAEIEVNAERETAGTVGMFASLMAAVERSQAELLEVVQMGRRAAELRSQAFIRDLQGEISELKNRISIHNQMIQSQDHQAFFKTFPAYNSIPVMKSWTDVVLTPDPTAGAVLRNVTQLVEVCQERLKRLSEICLNTSAENPADNLQLRMWKIQECAVDITLDRDSAHPRLIISQDGKQVYCSDRYQNVPDTLERFDRVVCVLGRQGFNSGCHYWEILVGDKTDWDLGVAGHSISRKGKIAANPSNGYWFLSLRDKNDYVFRSEPTVPIYPNPKPQRIGVYVDYDKGQLAFYNADSKTQMFVFTHSFSDTLYPFFSPCTNKSGKNEAPLIICNTFPAD